MAKQIQKEKNIAKKKIKRQDSLILERINYLIIFVGLVVIVAGYFALSATPWDNPIALNVAPILLVLGYCVIIPLGLLYKKRKPNGDVTLEQPGDQPQVG